MSLKIVLPAVRPSARAAATASAAAERAIVEAFSAVNRIGLLDRVQKGCGPK